MKELYVFCEGQTEQGFCKRLLQPYFFPDHAGKVHPIRIAHSRKKGRISRGCVNKYQPVQQIPDYEGDKTTVGPDVTEYIGMEKLMISCEHVREWVTTIAIRLQQM